MLTCKQLVENSSDLLDQRLSIRTRISVRMHLLMCANCRRFIKNMRLSQAVVRRLPAAESAELDALAAKLSEIRQRNQRR